MSKEYPPQQLHIPVMLDDVLQLLEPKVGESYLDLTAGYGGHADAILKITGSSATLVDRDENAIAYLQTLGLKDAELIHQDFASAAKQLVDNQQAFDLVLVDLGVSSPQFDQAERGFSFRHDAPLDMRMDPGQKATAAELVNNLNQDELAKIIRLYGEEKPFYARKIAQAIVDNRPLHTTGELADIVKQNIRSKGRIHPATRTFQALRIATNDELGQIEQMLPLLPDLLNPGGRVAIISFHSLEDRLVKQYIKSQKEMGLEAEIEPITKRPIEGSTTDVHNPRARSAKLRGAVKIKNRKDYTR
ncbi:MAG: 16S rRNA (cytosine(1402)-N(4))-methyltransferase RsmH [Candidatus Saccharibacteria bacterium]|nr:16S rRNA (cytosine(1402)-N(4))-methyltransferase RsmH [Candidatus Saccharibacteria bacterium]